MFQLHDLRKSKVWQEAHETGVEEGREKGREEGREQGKTLAQQKMVRNCLAKGMAVKDVADLMGLPVKEVRRLAKKSSS